MPLQLVCTRPHSPLKRSHQVESVETPVWVQLLDCNSHTSITENTSIHIRNIHTHSKTHKQAAPAQSLSNTHDIISSLTLPRKEKTLSNSSTKSHRKEGWIAHLCHIFFSFLPPNNKQSLNLLVQHVVNEFHAITAQ